MDAQLLIGKSSFLRRVGYHDMLDTRTARLSHPLQRAQKTPDFLLRGPSHGSVYRRLPLRKAASRFVDPTKRY